MPLLLIMIFLTGLGLLALCGTVAARKRLLTEALPDRKSQIAELLFQPFQELLLGLVFTFAGFYFAQRIFGGRQALLLSLAIAAGISGMTSYGAWTRFRESVKAFALPPAPERRLLQLQRIICLGILFMLLGLLAGLALWLGFGRA